ncbi:MAG TPA: hypothetical protein VLJ39_04815 [Tepidisphaeraceae bacterium]|nr:hypothetical protein [Tepidisphaeraceae bacterium]
MAQLETVLQTLERQDAFAAIDLIVRDADPIAAAKSFLEVMRHLYWQKKNLALSVMLAQAGADFGLSEAVRADASDAAVALQLRSIAKGLLYDIASFTWPGWDEPGILITPTDMAIGYEAAKGNLRLARDLNKGDLPLSRAHWMLAGHQLCGRDYAGAEQSYALAAKHAALAGAKSEELLAAGFGRLTDLFISPGSVITQQQLDLIQQDLRRLENGPEFIGQMLTAMRVFSARVPVAR